MLDNFKIEMKTQDCKFIVIPTFIILSQKIALFEHLSLCLFNFFHLHVLARKPILENFSIYSNKFFHNFHLSESSFTCPGLRASELAWRLTCWFFTAIFNLLHFNSMKRAVKHIDSTVILTFTFYLSYLQFVNLFE
jgi:hypothetical protein